MVCLMRLATIAILLLAGCAAGADESDAFLLPPAERADGGAAAPPPPDAGVTPRDLGPIADARPEPPDQGAPPEPEWHPCDAERLAAHAEAFGQQVLAAGIPGAGLAIVCEGRIALHEVYGVRRRGGEPVTPRTRFQLASITKMFTGATAVSLAQAGEVDLNAPIAAQLPGAAFGAISLHDLLSHTSGFPTGFDEWDAGLVSVVRANLQMSLWSPPGHVWNYSNPGFTVAGAVVELASGQPFADSMRRRVFEPSGMTRATVDVPALIADGDFAYGHPEGEGPQAPDDAYFHTGYYLPMGGAWGTAEDLARWAIAHIERAGGVTTPEGWRALQTPYSETAYVGSSYAYGHFVDVATDPVAGRHGGGAPGFIADFTVYPEAGFAVAVVFNGESGWPDAIEAMKEEVGLRFVGEFPAMRPAADYAGTYRGAAELGTIEVGADLSARFVDHGYTVQLEHLGGDSFVLPVQHQGHTDYVRFWPDDSGQLRYLASVFGVATR